MQNGAEPEISVPVVQVLPPSWVTASKIGLLMVMPPLPSLKTVQVTMALPLPQAVTYSLSLKMPGLLNVPVPEATRSGVDQVLPPSVEWATRMSGLVQQNLPCEKRKPSVER